MKKILRKCNLQWYIIKILSIYKIEYNIVFEEDVN